jgi:LysR family glycine cleavage system transcriptional activator
MRKFRIPSIAALMAFEAAARHESFTLAAKEVSLTESAISRQIAVLESTLGVSLFVRNKQRVVLTRAGALYATQIRRSMQSLDRDTVNVMAMGSSGGYLDLAVLPTFASHWLIPRIHDFNTQHPDILINMGVETDIFTFSETHFEAAIHYGAPTWPGCSADYLFGEEVVPICSKHLIKQPVSHPKQLLDYPLLHSRTRPDAWRKWFSDVEINDPKTMVGVRYELHTMLMSGAAAGLGIALVPKFFVENQLDQFNLIIPYQTSGITESAYYLVYPTELSHGKPLTQFRHWLLQEAADYAQEQQAE